MKSTIDFVPVIKTRSEVNNVANLSSWTVKMFHIKYFLYLRPYVKTSNQISGSLKSNIESSSTKL